MLGKLVIAPFPLTEQVGADEVQVVIIDIDPACGDLVLYSAVSVFAGDRIPAGLIQHIWHAFHLECRKAAGGCLIDRREHRPQRLLFDIAEHGRRDVESRAVDTLILPDQPSGEGTPYIIDAGDLPSTEEIFLDESDAVLNRLSEYSYKASR